MFCVRGDDVWESDLLQKDNERLNRGRLGISLFDRYLPRLLFSCVTFRLCNISAPLHGH